MTGESAKVGGDARSEIGHEETVIKRCFTRKSARSLFDFSQLSSQNIRPSFADLLNICDSPLWLSLLFFLL
jgi:hypothetical protein